MILPDTSIWIAHFRSENKGLSEHLLDDDIVTHPFIAGELALGSLANRGSVLGEIDRLPQISVADDDEVRKLIERRELYSKGIGWVDAHLIASTLIDRSVRLWTTDKRLARVASEVGIQLLSSSLSN